MALLTPGGANAPRKTAAAAAPVQSRDSMYRNLAAAAGFTLATLAMACSGKAEFTPDETGTGGSAETVGAGGTGGAGGSAPEAPCAPIVIDGNAAKMFVVRGNNTFRSVDRTDATSNEVAFVEDDVENHVKPRVGYSVEDFNHVTGAAKNVCVPGDKFGFITVVDGEAQVVPGADDNGNLYVNAVAGLRCAEGVDVCDSPMSMKDFPDASTLPPNFNGKRKTLIAEAECEDKTLE